MAPLKSGHAVRAATARADLLVELCGRRTLISFDQLLQRELGGLDRPQANIHPVINQNGEWYPEWEESPISPVQWAETWRAISEETKSHGLNREMRRKLKHKVVRKGKPTFGIQTFLSESAEGFDYSQLVQLYPMRLEDARVLGRYAIGTATVEEANKAFLESLRDPRWMMRWFVAHADTLSPVNEWLRSPARNMTRLVGEVADAATKLYALRSQLGNDFGEDILSRGAWLRQQDKMLVNVAASVRQAIFKDRPERTLKVAEIDELCPGFATMVRTAHNSIRSSVMEQPRKPKDSDFLDAVHAMYAPYVDVFRTDGFMAPHVEACALSNTRVVPKLSQLVPLLDRLITPI